MGPRDPAPPLGLPPESRPQVPQTRLGNTALGPFGPAWNLPSTVFFLKKDAMVKDRSQAARFGPVRKRTGERTGPGRVRGGEAEGLEERTGSPGRTRRGRYPRSLPQPTLRRSGDCELRHFLEKSLLGGACALQSAPAH